MFKLAHIHIDGTCIHTTLSRNWGRRSCRFTRPLWKRLGSSKSETEDSFLRSRATRGSFLFSPCKYEQYSHRLGSFSSSSWVPVKRISSFTVVNYPNKAIYLCQGQEHGCLSLVLFSPLLLCLLFLSFFLSSSSLYSFLGNRLFLLSILFFFFRLSTMDTSSSPDPGHIKRLKVGRACYTCRAKKIKVNLFLSLIAISKIATTLTRESVNLTSCNVAVRWTSTVYAGKYTQSQLQQTD